VLKKGDSFQFSVFSFQRFSEALEHFGDFFSLPDQGSELGFVEDSDLF